MAEPDGVPQEAWIRLGAVQEIVRTPDDKRMAEYFKNRTNITVEGDLKNVIKLNNRPKDKERVSKPQRTSDADMKNTAKDDVNALIEALANSISFAETHSIISKLSSSSHMPTSQQELRILSVALANQQVEWILKDDDVSEYIKPIFLRHKEDLIDSEYTRYLDAFDLPDEREEKRESPFFTTKEKRLFAISLMKLLATLSVRAIYQLSRLTQIPFLRVFRVCLNPIC